MATARSRTIDRGMSGDRRNRLAHIGPRLADFALAGLFLWAGLVKAWGPQSLAETIAAYRVLPGVLVDPAAHLLPWWEIAGGLTLLSRRCVAPARGVLIGLLTLYAGVALAAWARGLSVGCGCFGGAGSGPAHVAFRDLLILAGLAALWSPRLGRCGGRRVHDGV